VFFFPEKPVGLFLNYGQVLEGYFPILSGRLKYEEHILQLLPGEISWPFDFRQFTVSRS